MKFSIFVVAFAYDVIERQEKKRRKTVVNAGTIHKTLSSAYFLADLRKLDACGYVVLHNIVFTVNQDFCYLYSKLRLLLYVQ